MELGGGEEAARTESRSSCATGNSYARSAARVGLAQWAWDGDGRNKLAKTAYHTNHR